MNVMNFLRIIALINKSKKIIEGPINEIRDMSQRLEVARMLEAGEKYDQIEKETGASTATISRVKRCLKYGADGYLTVLSRLNELGGNKK
jgi:TrpR-related protein YerC/YecD